MIAAWADAGAPEGDRADLPPAPTFTEGWSIGKPDLVFTMLKPFNVPADGTVPYIYITIPTNLKEDIWIRGVELKPSDRRVVHHIISDLIEGDGKPVDPKPKLDARSHRKEVGGGLGGLVPGRLYGLYEEGVARKIPAGADIVLQMHYTTIGQPVTDQTQIGVVLAKEPPTKLRAGGGGADSEHHRSRFRRAIPTTRSSREADDQPRHLLEHDVSAHARARQGRLLHDRVSRRPRGSRAQRAEVRLQLAAQLPACRAEVHSQGIDAAGRAHYDNSKDNPFNPDPTATVRWGEQTWEEMLIGYYGTIEIAKPKSTTTMKRRQFLWTMGAAAICRAPGRRGANAGPAATARRCCYDDRAVTPRPRQRQQRDAARSAVGADERSPAHQRVRAEA